MERFIRVGAELCAGVAPLVARVESRANCIAHFLTCFFSPSSWRLVARRSARQRRTEHLSLSPEGENAFSARETCGKARVPPDCLRLRVRPPNSPWRRPSAAAATTTKLAAAALRCRCCLRCRPSSRPATASSWRGLRCRSSASRAPPSASITAFHASRSCCSLSYKSKRTASASPPFQRMAAQSSRREYRRRRRRRASRLHRRRV